MMNCPHEDALLEALGRGYVGPDLDGHIATCESCRELQLVAGALLGDHQTAVTEAPVPPSSAMWWQMQARQRAEAAAAARRSLLFGQALTLVIAIALTFGLLRGEFAHAFAAVTMPVLLTIATFLIAAPIAGYVAIRQK